MNDKSFSITVTQDPYNGTVVVQEQGSNPYSGKPMEEIRYTPQADGSTNIFVSSREFASFLTGLTGAQNLLEARDKLTGRK